VSQLAIAWTLANPAVHVAIVGSRRAEHIEASIDASRIRLDHDQLGEIERIVSGAAAVGGPSPERV